MAIQSGSIHAQAAMNLPDHLDSLAENGKAVLQICFESTIQPGFSVDQLFEEMPQPFQLLGRRTQAPRQA